jgi:hypothetical protein
LSVEGLYKLTWVTRQQDGLNSLFPEFLFSFQFETTEKIIAKFLSSDSEQVLMNLTCPLICTP